MKDEFIIRIENRIKQKEGIIKEYEKSLRLNKKHKVVIKNNEVLYIEIEKLNKVVYELFNVIDIYKDILKGGLKG